MNEPDVFFSTLQHELAEGKLPHNNIPLLMDELINIEQRQSNFAHWDQKALQAEIGFVLKELWNTCEKRLLMSNSIKLQNELVAVLANSSVTILDMKPTALVYGEVLSTGR